MVTTRDDMCPDADTHPGAGRLLVAAARPCCVEEWDTFGSTQYCRWNCRYPRCPAWTPFADGCYSVPGPMVCPDPYVFTASPSYGAACCPPPPNNGCADGECQGDAPDDRDGNTIGQQTDYGQCPCASPVLIDVLGDGFRLTDLAGGVRFDLNGDGRAGRLAWTQTGTDDAWLALDRDGDGLITSGRELFGNLTAQPDPPPGVERNGFLALAEFDRAERGGNADGVIDARDAVFSSLRLWRDANHNGVSEPDELHALASLDVVRLHLKHKESKREDEHGNRFKYRAKVDDARGAKAGRWAWDVFLLTGP